MQGKYSPTVSYWYRQDQDWFEKNGGGFGNGRDTASDLDDEGYDSYGYSGHGDGPDRAGFTEDQYNLNESLYEDVADEWRYGPPGQGALYPNQSSGVFVFDQDINKELSTSSGGLALSIHQRFFEAVKSLTNARRLHGGGDLEIDQQIQQMERALSHVKQVLACLGFQQRWAMHLAGHAGECTDDEAAYHLLYPWGREFYDTVPSSFLYSVDTHDDVADALMIPEGHFGSTALDTTVSEVQSLIVDAKSWIDALQKRTGSAYSVISRYHEGTDDASDLPLGKRFYRACHDQES